MGRKKPRHSWTRHVPKSRMVYPEKLLHKVKYTLWRGLTPIHPYVRDAALALKIVYHEPGRQDFLLGTISPGETMESVVKHLIGNGYGNHFVAWQDEDEVISLRKADCFEYQYHVRIYEDGEIRGHYEYTPECYPILHMKEIGMEPRREHFLELLKGKIDPAA